jgi:hypothetical protein
MRYDELKDKVNGEVVRALSQRVLVSPVRCRRVPR